MDQRQIKSMYSWLVLFFFLMTFGACVEESKDLTRAEKTRVDTLVARQTQALRLRIDSICTADFEKNVNEAKDSILQIRIQEIEAILNRK